MSTLLIIVINIDNNAHWTMILEVLKK